MSDAVFDADLISRYGGQRPRYTSCPTAVQFGPGFDTADYEREALRFSNRVKTSSSLGW